MAVANVQDAIMLLGDSITEFGFTSGGFAARLAGERALVTLLCRAEMCDIDPMLRATIQRHMSARWTSSIVDSEGTIPT